MSGLSERGYLRRADQVGTTGTEKVVTRESRLLAVERNLVPEYLRLQERIKLDNFAHEPGYSKEAVEIDKKALETRLRLKESYLKNRSEHEAILKLGAPAEAATFTALQSILGSEAQVLPAAKFDDVMGGNDMVIVWNIDDAEPVTISIDVTPNEREAPRKIDHHFTQADEGKLHNLEYVEGYLNGHTLRRKIKNAAPVVIACDSEKIAQVGKVLVDCDNSTEKLSKELRQSSMPYMLLYQIEAQLRAMKRYAEERRKTPIAKTYERALQKIETVLERLPIQIKTRIEERLARDEAYKKIATHAWEGALKGRLPQNPTWPIH